MNFHFPHRRQNPNAEDPDSTASMSEEPLTKAPLSEAPLSEAQSLFSSPANTRSRRVPRLPLGCLIPAPGLLTFSLPPQPDLSPGQQRLPVRIPVELAEQVQNIAWRSVCTDEQAAEVLINYGLYRHSAARQLLVCWQQLTRREQQVSRLVALELSIQEISRQLKLKPNTVRLYLKIAQEKFGVPSRREFLHCLSLLESLVAGLVVDFGEDESET